MLSICPNCQAKLKVPDQMENQKGKCPKCQKIFVITKCDVVAEAKTNANEKESIVVPVEKKSQPVKPSVTSEVSQVIEPNLQDLEISPRIIQTNVVVNQAVAPSNSLGIASLVVAIMSYFMCWLPGIGLIISGLAVLLGLGGLFMALKRKGTGVGYSIAGVVLAAMSLIITFVWSSAVFQAVDKVANASNKANANIAKPVNENIDVQNQEPKKQNLPPNEQAKKNEGQNNLIDASKEFAKFHNIEVKIKSVNIDFVTGKSFRDFTSKEKLLKIVLSVNNLNPNKKVDFDGWGDNDLSLSENMPSLNDNFGNSYKTIGFGLSSKVDGQIGSEALYPNKPVSDMIVFEVPLKTVDFLVLDLPAKNLKLDGRIRFKIPSSMIDLDVKKAQEKNEILKKKDEQEREKQMLAMKQAEAEAEKAKQKAMADIAIDEADRKKKFEEKGLTYYPLPRTFYEGRTADQWYQLAIKIQLEPSSSGQLGPAAFSLSPNVVRTNNEKNFQEAINSLMILKDEGVPFLLEALQKQTTTQGRAFYLQAIKGELVHPNDIPVIIGSLAANKNQIQTRMIALRTLAKNPGSKKHYEKIRGMVADLFPNNNVKVEVAELLKAIAK